MGSLTAHAQSPAAMTVEQLGWIVTGTTLEWHQGEMLGDGCRPGDLTPSVTDPQSANHPGTAGTGLRLVKPGVNGRQQEATSGNRRKLQ